jgi:hypothetical protein
MELIAKTLITAGGKITCLRCNAMSKRTKLQCGAPASKNKTKCKFHGGKSSGAKTEEGKLKAQQGNLSSGNETKEARLERSQKALWFAQCEDVMHTLKMTHGPRVRGPKPLGYEPIESMEDVRLWVLQDALNKI